ncbi:hypothetical protein KDN24_03575 [Bacillus sp. Bva_UNVM-123]|uniref:hypothetical protein n=1 Tax=Bacillus sp. Bva_UNVM-123 TaxID=2829798 RepID=UPI00391F5170
MTKDTNQKSKGWLKGVLSTRSQVEQMNNEDLETTEFIDEQPNSIEEYESAAPLNNKQLFSKDNQDKVALDLILSLENMLNDRQLIQFKNKGLKEQLDSSNETISRLKYDIAKKEQLLQDKSLEINTLESNLTNKQMNYDQLLEDYKDYQYNAKNDFDKISNKLEIEITKYNKLNEEYIHTHHQNMLKIKELEERIRELEIENHQYADQYARVVNEKTELMNTVNDFAERMSFSFAPKTAANNSLSGEK